MKKNKLSKHQLLKFMIQRVSTLGSINVSEVSIHKSFSLLGVSSLDGIQFIDDLNKLMSKEPSKIGAVVWAGTGSVGPSINELSYWMPNVGLGLRYELQPRLNLRLDYGIGYNSTGFYFNFSEAF